MACKDCLKNCDPQITDRCIAYTGADRTSLGICKGDSLYEVETIILDLLEGIADGTGTIVSGATTCTYFSSLLANNTKTVENLFNALITGECDLDTRITALAATVNAPASFNTSCLSGTLTTRDQILQAVITLLCSVNTSVETITDDYVKQSDLCTQVAVCVESSASTNYKDRMVPYSILPYTGPLSNFDNTGKGLSAFGFSSIYLMNGLNGTEDWRGRSPIGAIQNVPGSTLDANIDPAIPANASYNWTINEKKGTSTHTLATSEAPAHTHAVTDPGHKHFTISNIGSGTKGASLTLPVAWTSNRANGNQDYDLCVVNGTANAGPTNTSTTGISLGLSGSGGAHNNVQPSIGCYYITYIP